MTSWYAAAASCTIRSYHCPEFEVLLAGVSRDDRGQAEPDGSTASRGRDNDNEARQHQNDDNDDDDDDDDDGDDELRQLRIAGFNVQQHRQKVVEPNQTYL